MLIPSWLSIKQGWLRSVSRLLLILYMKGALGAPQGPLNTSNWKHMGDCSQAQRASDMSYA